MAVATKPEPRMTEPVFVSKLGEEGSLSMISEALSAGGWVDIARLNGIKERVRGAIEQGVRKTYDWNLETAVREAWGLALPTVRKVTAHVRPGGRKCSWTCQLI